MKGNFKFGSPFVILEIEGKRVELMLGTGFNGSIILPHDFIDELSLEKIGTSDYMTISGEEFVTDVYKGTIMLFDEQKEVVILSTKGDFYLAGMELFDNCRIVIEKKNNLVEVLKL